MRERFWELPIESLDREEWEALCDGCGKCCLHKLEDEVTGELFPTNVACRLLDRQACRCSNYKFRKALVPDCVRLDLKQLREIDWLPSTCAYRLRGDGKPLPDWHYLVSGEPRDGARSRHLGARLDDIGGRRWRSGASSRRPALLRLSHRGDAGQAEACRRARASCGSASTRARARCC